MTNRPSFMDPRNSFQGLILTLQQFWAEQGCVILQPYDMPMGAGTSHTGTRLPMRSHRAAPPMAAMAKTPTGCSTIISFR